jgi:hypothetical protein
MASLGTKCHQNASGCSNGPIRDNTWKARISGLKSGSADAFVPRVLLCFLTVASMWSLCFILCAWQDSLEVGSLVGPWIHVMSTCLSLIRRRVIHLDQWRVYHLRSMWQPSPQPRWRGPLHRRWVSISFLAHFTYIQIISKDKWNYIILNKMRVINAYASILCENIDA